MIYSFFTPLDKAETCSIIKKTIATIGGKTKDVSPYVFTGKWRSKQHRPFFAKKFTFYVGDGIVRVSSGSEEMQFITMRLPLRGIGKVWDHFVEFLLKLYPDYDFGLVPGDLHLVAVEFLSGATEQTFITTTEHSPSLAGAIIGGDLFGPAGAIIGSSYGTSRTKVTASTRFSKWILARGRYSNGLLAQGRVSVKSSTYHEILVNMRHLSQESPRTPASHIPTSLDEHSLSFEEKNALREARSYLSWKNSDFSRIELIEQLEYEGYSRESATKVVDSLHVDWCKQAAYSAKSYLESKCLSFSRKGLIEQLKHEGFTDEQAEFGVDSAYK